MARDLRSLLAGPPPALPPLLDRLAERWAGAGPRVRLLLGALLAAAVLAVAGRGAATSPWGPEAPVLVAARDLPAGRALAPGDLEEATWPQRLVPRGAPTSAAAVGGRTLAVGLPAGTPLAPSHLAVDGVAADLPADRVAYPLPLTDGTVLAAGQHVDLVAGDGSGGGLRLAAGARVLAVDATTAWVAVRRSEAPAVAGAVAWGQVVAVVLPVGADDPP